MTLQDVVDLIKNDVIYVEDVNEQLLFDGEIDSEDDLEYLISKVNETSTEVIKLSLGYRGITITLSAPIKVQTAKTFEIIE